MKILLFIFFIFYLTSPILSEDYKQMILDMELLQENPKSLKKRKPVKKNKKEVDPTRAYNKQHAPSIKGIREYRSQVINPYQKGIKSRTEINGILLDAISNQYGNPPVIVKLQDERFPDLDQAILEGRYQIYKKDPSRVFIRFSKIELRTGQTIAISAFARDPFDFHRGINAEVNLNTGNRLMQAVLETTETLLTPSQITPASVIDQKTNIGLETEKIVTIASRYPVIVVFDRTQSIQ